jgi:hypothetical protein
MTMGFTKRRLEEETMMKEWLRATYCGIVLWGCAGSRPARRSRRLHLRRPPQDSISTFQNASGKWDGIVRTIPPSRNDDWVTLIIREDGVYAFEAVRTIGITH